MSELPPELESKCPHSIEHLSPLPSNREIGIGCIGAGFIMADCHLVAYRDAGLNPVAIAARRRDQAEQVAQRHRIERVYGSAEELLRDPSVEVVDIAVPPDEQLSIVRQVVKHAHIRGVLAQKPLAATTEDAREIVRLCREAGITLCVNQNMRYDHSVRACRSLLEQNAIGDPVFSSIDMRAIPHWMPWQPRQGWLTCRIMSIHHLDTMRFWFGNPKRVFANFRSDPRTKFPHVDGIALYILEFDSSLRALVSDDVWGGPVREGAAEDLEIKWRVEGTMGTIKGTVGWPSYPERTPSTLDYTTIAEGKWFRPRWNEVWFPDAFVGPMAELLIALETETQPSMSGEDNLKTLELVDACYRSASERRMIDLA